MTQVMGRGLRAQANMRCDKCNKLIMKGKVAYQVRQSGAKAHGTYHGPDCYSQAVKDYEEKQRELGIEDEDIL